MDNNNTTTTTTESEYLLVSEYDVLKLEHQLIKGYDLWEAIGEEKLEGNILASVAGVNDFADMLCKAIKERVTCK